MPTDPRTYVGLALLVGITGFAIGGVIAAVRGTESNPAMIASVATLLGTLAGGLLTARRRGTSPRESEESEESED